MRGEIINSIPKTAEDKIKHLEDLNNRLMNLLWVTAQIATEQTPDTIYHIVVNGFSQLTEINKCSMYLVEPGVGLYEVAATGRVADELFWPSPSTTELLYDIVMNHTPGTGAFCLPLPDADHSRHPQKECTIRVVLVCPLKSSTGEIQGILCGFTIDDPNVGSDYQLLLDLYVNQVSLTLENMQLNRKLREFAFIDPLTGLYNRRHFHERLRSEINRSGRKKEPVSLLMIDVDNFKHYNDDFGHIAGDRALKQLGALLKSSLRQMDIIVRYGGEEFTVILPETSLAKGLAVAENLRGTIEGGKFAGRRLTVSIGVAAFPDQATDVDQLIDTSDRAMYAAKKLGRNQVSTVNPSISLHTGGNTP